MVTLTEIAGKNPVMKMHGIGNDFIVLSDFKDLMTPEVARKLCQRHYGVGADGIVTFGQAVTANKADAKFTFYNPDGTTAEMCGNGIRAFAKYGADNFGYSGKMKVETEAGILVPEIITNNERTALVKVNMGKPVLYDPNQVVSERAEARFTKVKSHTLPFTYVGMGNPHAVHFTTNPQQMLEEYGALVEANTAVLPQKTNVEFVKSLGNNKLEMCVYERGAGETLACGTGACASAVAAIAEEWANPNKPITVHLKGGDLTIQWEDFSWKDNTSGNIYMTGDAQNVMALNTKSLDSYLL